jgi:plastocyanin
MKTHELIGIMLITLILFFAGCSDVQEPAATTTTMEETTTTIQPTTTQPTTTVLASTTSTTTVPVTTTTLNPANTWHVKVSIFDFSPKYLTVAVGDTVVWTSAQTTMTVTSPGNATKLELDSPVIGPNATYSHTFTHTGEYKYYSKTHPQVTGTIRVNERLNITNSNQATSTGDINSAHGPNETGLSNGSYSLSGY